MFDARTVQTDTLVFDTATVATRGARNYQEDSVISHFPLGQSSGFAVVADGMGGAGNGGIASGLVISAVFDQLKMREATLESGTLNVPAALHDAVEQANIRVASHIDQDEETFGMGSTLLATVIVGTKLFWCSVGDSPLLLFRGGALRRLNKDHSMAPQIDMMVKTGAMTAEVGRDHPDRHTLTSAIMGHDIELIDCPLRPIALLPGDIVIVASDGLLSLPNRVIAKTLNETHAQHSIDVARALLNALQEQNSTDQDNATFVVFKLVDDTLDSGTMEAEDLPVLATADEDETPKAPPPRPATARASAESVGSMDLSDVDQNDDREGRAYWYRGQKYYRD